MAHKKKPSDLLYLMGDDPTRKRKPAPAREEEDDEEEDEEAPWADTGGEDPADDDWGDEPGDEQEDDDWSSDEVPPPPAGDWPPEEDEESPGDDDEEGSGGSGDDNGDDPENDEDEDDEDPFEIPPASGPTLPENLVDENDLDPEDEEDSPFEDEDPPPDEPLRFVSTPEAYIEALSYGQPAELEAGPTLLQRRGLDELLLRPAGLFTPQPQVVDVEIPLGGSRPITLSTPVLWTPMALGPLTVLAARTLARAVEVGGSCLLCPVALLPEVWPLTHRLWVEIRPGGHWPTPDILEEACGVVITLGARLPPEEQGEIPPVDTAAALANLTRDLRDRGIPVGIRLWAGALEQDLPPIFEAEPDLLIVDGQGSSRGDTPLWRREQLTLPLIYALPRITRLMENLSRRPQLVVSGGLRLPADVVRVHALGADLALMSTAPVVAAGLWRVSGGGGFSRGGNFRESEGAFHLANFSSAFKRELEGILTTLGKTSWAEVGRGDLYCISDGLTRELGLGHA